VAVWRDALHLGKRHLQGDMHERESQAQTVRNFQPTLIPGLLQTREYAERMFPLVDPTGRFDHAEAVDRRIERQQALLVPGQHFEFLLGEGALYWNPDPATDILPVQLDRVVLLASLETVDIAVLPLGGQAVAAPWCHFVIWEGDEQYVSMELLHGEVRVDGIDDVALYRDLYDRLWARAAKDADAVTLIRRVAAGLRN
jgi:hypothetical protein